MRHLAALSDVREVASDRYVHSKYSRELAAYPLVDAFKYMCVHATLHSARPYGRTTDDFTVSTITTMYGEILQSGLRREAGNIPRMRETRPHRPLGTFQILRYSSFLLRIRTLAQGSER